MPLMTNLNGHNIITTMIGRPPQQSCLRVNIHMLLMLTCQRLGVMDAYMSTSRCHGCLHVSALIGGTH
jgi:hypothetical protein